MQLGITPYSTRHKKRSIDSSEKSATNLTSQHSSNFFKKKVATDENEKNCMNYLEKIVGHNGQVIYLPAGGNRSINAKKNNVSGSSSQQNGYGYGNICMKKKSSGNSKNFHPHSSTHNLRTPTSVQSSIKFQANQNCNPQNAVHVDKSNTK